ncbi:MAG: hypothetical protein AB8I08_04920 [Sandaracinaceae bacterium]
MNRPFLRSLVLALSIAVVASGRAQTSSSMPEAHSPAEEEALETLANGLMISARTQAETILRHDEDSIVGHYVLGRAYFDAEGSLARAMYHLGRARELYEQRSVGTSGGAFHQELLFQTARLAGQMELYEFQLELLGYHDHLYDPDMIAERCWPLMKLGRIDEARAFAETAVGSPNPWQRSAGYNALCAVEGEARTRATYHHACLAAMEDARREAAAHAGDAEREGAGIAVDAYNASSAAAAALEFADAETLALEGARQFEPTPANPWRVLVELRLSAGQMDPAIEAFGQMMRWNDRTPASLRDQSRADIEATVATVLLFGGESEEALSHIDRALERPDRRGLTTDGAEQARGRHALLRRMIQRSVAEERAEAAAWRGFGARLWHGGTSLGDGLRAWPDEERVVAVLADEDRLTDTLRPYVPGGIDNLSPWMVGELVDLLGPAIVAVGLDRARALDEDHPGTAGYYTALEAEIAAARGDEEEAVELATQALGQLEGAGWPLVRARVSAVAGEAAEDMGRHRRANELYTEALETDPGVFRRLGLSLPVQVRGSGGDVGEAVSLLEASPRFHDSSRGFTLVVEGSEEGGLRACLRSSTDNEIRCAQVRPIVESNDTDEDEGDEEEGEEEEPLTLPQRLAQEVHRQLFSARIQLSSVDLRSLDGRTTGGSSVANERLRDLLNDADAP